MLLVPPAPTQRSTPITHIPTKGVCLLPTAKLYGDLLLALCVLWVQTNA